MLEVSNLQYNRYDFLISNIFQKVALGTVQAVPVGTIGI